MSSADAITPTPKPSTAPAPAAQGADAAPKKSTFADDLFASLVVFLVALPLSMGIALASGASVASGLIAAVVGGIVIGLTGGSPLLVSGPAAGLTVMVFGFISDLGFAATCLATVCAGVLQVIGGLSRTARVALAISPAVIHGMLAGIGILITLSQLQVVLGFAPLANAWKNIGALPERISGASVHAVLIGLLTLVVLVAWNALPWKKLKLIPSQLVAVGLATELSMFLSLDLPRVDFGEDVFKAIHLPGLPEDSKILAFIVAVISLNIVASAESLLSALATDKLHSGPRSNLDRELVGQGAGNIVSGLLGGLPVTGVIVRSAANISAGAKTKWSAVMHGVWLLIFITQLDHVIVRVPLASLGGLLVFVGIKLVNKDHIRELRHRGELPIYLATLAGVVGINLLAGIIIGVVLALLRLIITLARVKVEVTREAEQYEVCVTGSLTFLGVPTFTAAMQNVPAGSKVRVDLALELIDHAGFEALETWKHGFEKTGGHVEMEAMEDIWSRRKQTAAGTASA